MVTFNRHVLVNKFRASRIVLRGRAVQARSYFAVGIVASLTLFASTLAHGQQPAPGPVYGPGAVPVVVPAPARVIEQDLFVTDPTVAARQHWLIGVGGEGWLTAFPEWPYVDALSNTLKSTTTYFHNFGGNVTIGYDDLWAQFNYRTGKGTQSQPFDSGPAHVDSRLDRTQSEGEIKFRYLLRDLNLGSKERVMLPYVLAGYDDITISEDHRLETAGWFWTHTGAPDKLRTNTYKSGYLGGGVLAPFTPSFGMRADISFGAAYATQTDDNLLPGYRTGAMSAWGLYANIHATAYYNITDGLVAQVGLKETAIFASNLDINLFGAFGAYGSLGYIYRF